MKNDNMKINTLNAAAQAMAFTDIATTTPADLRSALGQFATGVCILTGRDTADAPFGMTINSFGSVSLDPPLVMWTLDRSTPDLARYLACERFCVSVLSRDQAALCFAFADDRLERFEGLDWPDSPGGCPTVPGALATFDCHVDARHEVGDHTLVVAALTGVNAPGGEALVYQGGRIADALPQVDGPPDESPFVERYAGALLGRASAEVNADFARSLPDDLKPVHWRILACLSESALTVNALADAVLLKQPTLTRVLDGMVVTGLVTRESDASDRRRVLVTATDSGRERGEALVALAIEREQAFFADWSASERDVLHHLLRRLLADRADANEQPTETGEQPPSGQ